jgi:hypothetical protein
MAVCTTGANLSPADRVEILAVLVHDPDELISTLAGDGLINDSPSIFAEALAREHAVPQLFAYAARNLGDKPGIAETMIRNKNCAGDHLAPLVPHLSPLMVNALMEELDRVSASHALAHALEHSAHLTADHKNTLRELRSAELMDPTRLTEVTEEAEPDPAKRQTRIGSDHRIDENHSRFQVRREEFLFLGIIRPRAGCETERTVVCHLDRTTA